MFMYRGIKKNLKSKYGTEQADKMWKQAYALYRKMQIKHLDITGDSKMMILPAAALYKVLLKHDPEHALSILKDYGKQMGERIASIVHVITSVPGVPEILWKNMPKLMRKMSSPKMGYTRRIVSESPEFVGVDILSCPLHDAAIRLGMEEIAQVVCAMDKAYMNGFKHIEYTRNMSVAEGNACCDYRLRYDKNKK